ncbi:MAG: hypothetical protein QOI95_343 [Acidimicrobiaceae bacterium]
MTSSVSPRTSFGLVPLLAGAYVAGGVLSAITTFKQDDKHYAGFFVSLAVLTVVTGIVYAVGSRVLAAPSGLKAIAFAVVAFFSLALFWSGAPVVVAAACGRVAAEVRQNRAGPGLATVAIAVAGVVAALEVFLALVA